MKKLLIMLTFLFISFNSVFAESIDIIEPKDTSVSFQNDLKINWEESIIFFASLIEDVPSSYKYIWLNFKGIEKWSRLEDALKKLVYLDKFKNLDTSLTLKKNLNAYEFYTIANNTLDLWFEVELNKEQLKITGLIREDLIYVEDIYLSRKDEAKSSKVSVLWDKEKIFKDVYETLLNWHYDKSNLEKDDLLYWALEGLANWTSDPYTAFFPPVENQSFEDSLAWEFEWIGAYVEMSSPWVPKIVNPIPSSPAEKAGIKWWDVILKVGDKEVTRNNSLSEVTSWIKWPAGTEVVLTILRGWEELEFKITREKIVVNNLETQELNSSTFLIKINTFWQWVSSEFEKALTELKSKSNMKKLIIDLRNNWGWYLNEVTKMLSYIVPKWENTAVIKYLWYDESITSAGYDLINLNNYKVIVLQNSWTASASEIMIWTMNDYFKDLVTIWENTFGKGSVQTIREYNDGSSLKYTIAKWFTGWTQTWIDGVWIAPDVELELDIESYQKDWTDNQLQKAINY